MFSRVILVVVFIVEEETSKNGATALFGTSFGQLKGGLCPFYLGSPVCGLLGDLVTAPNHVRAILVAVVIVMAVLVPVRAPGVSTLACCLVLTCLLLAS